LTNYLQAPDKHLTIQNAGDNGLAVK